MLTEGEWSVCGPICCQLVPTHPGCFHSEHRRHCSTLFFTFTLSLIQIGACARCQWAYPSSTTPLFPGSKDERGSIDHLLLRCPPMTMTMIVVHPGSLFIHSFIQEKGFIFFSYLVLSCLSLFVLVCCCCCLFVCLFVCLCIEREEREKRRERK